MTHSQIIRPETLEALIRLVSDPRRLGGSRRAFGIAGRRLGREIQTHEEAREVFAALQEEDALALIAELERLMPDLTLNTIFETLRRLRRQT